MNSYICARGGGVRWSTNSGSLPVFFKPVFELLGFNWSLLLVPSTSCDVIMQAKSNFVDSLSTSPASAEIKNTVMNFKEFLKFVQLHVYGYDFLDVICCVFHDVFDIPVTARVSNAGRNRGKKDYPWIYLVTSNKVTWF